ncbi:MAG: site-specific integrase [Mangrovibacterium sp.]
MSSTFKVLFYLRKNHINKNGKSAIMIRVSLNGERTAFSSKLEIAPDLWDTKMNCVKGKSFIARDINSYMDEYRSRIRTIYDTISREDGYATAEKIKNVFLGYSIKQQTVLSLFKQHNEDIKKQIGINKSQDTYGKYVRTCERVTEFMKARYNLSDIPLREINHKFITDFDIYLRVDCRYSINTSGKYMQRFRSIILLAKSNGWIQADPFVNYKIRQEKVDRGYLTEDEIEIIMKKQFATERLEQVRDIFIFSCFTGLAYVDVKNLTVDNIQKSFDGSLWIKTKRQKTSTSVDVPLLTVPQMILDKYQGKLKDGRLLPILSNQKTNSYLKEIADVCGINKHLTYHVLRHPKSHYCL